VTDTPRAAEFLAAALAAAEATSLAAASANGGNWVTDGIMVNADDVEVCEPSLTEEHANHIAANDPAHVLRIVAAHRVLLDDHNPDSLTGRCRYCHYGMDAYDTPCWTLKLLADAYGWTPEAES
jgi:hypothetical protein